MPHAQLRGHVVLAQAELHKRSDDYDLQSNQKDLLLTCTLNVCSSLLSFLPCECPFRAAIRIFSFSLSPVGKKGSARPLCVLTLALYWCCVFVSCSVCFCETFPILADAYLGILCAQLFHICLINRTPTIACTLRPLYNLGATES